MDDFVVYDFRIDVWKPETLPLKRLAEYANELAKLFGSTANVHLLKIRRGSHIQEFAVDQAAKASVERQLALVRTADAPEEIMYVSKPHIGTFRLVKMVEKMRESIEALGGEMQVA